MERMREADRERCMARKLNIQYIEEFTVLAECLNFSIAAERLYISQPTLSRHITALEAELGFKLVERKPFTRLTPMGKSFYLEAGELLDETLTALDGIADRIALENRNAVTMRVPDLSQMIFHYKVMMDRAAQLFQEEHAPLTVNFEYIDAKVSMALALEDFLRGSTLDCLFMFAAHGDEPPKLGSPRLHQRLIGTQELKLVMGKGNPLSKKEPIRLSDLGGGSFKCYRWDGSVGNSYFDAIERLFAMSGVELSYRKPFAIPDSSGVWSSINLNDSVTFMMDGATIIPGGTDERFFIRTIEDFPILIDYYLVYLQDSDSPEIAWFVDALEQSAKMPGQTAEAV
jgi:DNA-binding transcriptional LysR family regulator